MDSIPSSPTPGKKGFLPLALAGVICGAAIIVLAVFGTIIVLLGKFVVSSVSRGPSATHDEQEEPAIAVADNSAPDPGEIRETPAPAESESDLKALPAWIPMYPNLLKPAHGPQQEENGVVSGTIAFETGDSADKVKAFYESKLKTAGFEMTVDRTTTRQSENVQIAARKEGEKRIFHAAMRQVKDRTAVTLNYEGPIQVGEDAGGAIQ